jgi:AmmeMemoRadiSam system protein A
MYSAAERSTLLRVAHASIDTGLQTGKALAVNAADYPAPLTEKRASFVTLTQDGTLRGCIGSLEAHRMLVEDVAGNAYAAAFRDPRFPPLQQQEFGALDIQVSVLGTPEPVAFTSEQDLLDSLRPGVDGLILQEQNSRGTFLPSVWESLPQPEDFLNHLKLKTGLSTGYWSETIQVWRYTTESFSAPVRLAGGDAAPDISAG